MPPQIFPHDPVPEGERVPLRPEPYQRFSALDVENKVYDLEHDNFEIKPGYISEDGLIDDQSVVWDYDNNKVICKFRGGEPIIWDFWKPKDTFDVPGPGPLVLPIYTKVLLAAESGRRAGTVQKKIIRFAANSQ